LSWLLKQILNSPSYLNTIERRVRGFPAKLFSEIDTRAFLMLANMNGLRGLMKEKSHTDRRTYINDTFRRLDPNLCVHWEHEWRSLKLRLGETPEKEVAARVTKLRFPDAGRIWLKSAQSELRRRGMEVQQGSSEVGSPWVNPIIAKPIISRRLADVSCAALDGKPWISCARLRATTCCTRHLRWRHSNENVMPLDATVLRSLDA
jgi:hypothetical protein